LVWQNSFSFYRNKFSTLSLFSIVATIKKTISIFLILLLGFNSFGLFFFYWGEIQLCKIKADEYSDADYIPAKSLSVFSSDTKGIKMVDKNEILVAGKLYDIVKTQISNGITLYYALGDEDEDKYVQNLTDWEKNNSEEKSMPGKTINLHLAKYFTVEKYHDPVSPLLHLRIDVKTASDSFFYTSPLKNIFSPPPDNLLS
jgi:hypothetical protein